METGTPSAPNGGPGSSSFFGIRDPAARALVALVLVALIGFGGYLVYDRYYLTPKRQRQIETGEYTKNRYQRWKRKGRPGWERLFEEAKKGFPGYSVDTGSPARRVLAEVGADLKPFLEDKLRSDDFRGRMSAIRLLGEIGEPTSRIVELLEKELESTSERSEEVAVFKCAAVVPEGATVLTQVAFEALESPNPATRYRAAAQLLDLAGKKGAPQELVDRVDDLRTNGDLATRIDFAVAATRQHPRAAYEMLLEGLADDDEEAFAAAARHMDKLRDTDKRAWEMAPEERAAAVADHCTYLNMELSVLDMRRALAAGRVPRETYEMLLRLLDHEDVQIVDAAADHVSELSGQGELRYDTTDKQRARILEADRAWLKQQLGQEEEAASNATSDTETAEDAGEATSEDDQAIEGSSEDGESVESPAETGDESKLEEEEVKAQFLARIVSHTVVCDECGETTTGLDIPYSEAKRFQTCPKCGKRAARPVVYYVCLNPDCNKTLIRVRNHIFEDADFYKSPDDFVCPACGRPDRISPNVLSIEEAEKIAKETGQELQ